MLSFLSFSLFLFTGEGGDGRDGAEEPTQAFGTKHLRPFNSKEA
jgi:hypothetical protein